MTFRTYFYALNLSLLSLSSCAVLTNSNGREFDDDYYIQKVNKESTRVYIDVEEEMIRIHPINDRGLIDTFQACQFYYSDKSRPINESVSFHKRSFDLDVLTIPIKIRPAQEDVPSQFQTGLNLSLFAGYRTDQYKLKYEQNPFGRYKRKISHYGFSFGLFSGIGSSLIYPGSTADQVDLEYEGIIINSGIATIIAIENFNIGLAVGIDKLLDRNRRLWIHESKPWFGFAFGIDLN
jgi:hypothetical protein